MSTNRATDAHWQAVLQNARSADGSWFDEHLRIQPCAGSRHLEQYRDALYAPIFLANGGRDRNRAERLAVLDAFLSNLTVSTSQLEKTGGRRGPIRIHLNRNRWLQSSFSYDHVVKVFRHFRGSRLVDCKPGYYNRQTKEGKVTRIMPTPRLVEALCSGVTRDEAEFYVASRPDRPVILKDREGVPVPYRETRFVRELIRKINYLNAVHSTFAISYERPDTGRRYPVNPYVYAVFNGDWKTAGRFYGGRHSHVNMTEEARRTMLIDGQPIAELDYASLHVHLLYAKVGASFTGGDPYLCVANAQGLRGLLKEVLLSLLNDRCSERALIAHVEFRLLRRHCAIHKGKHPLAWEEAASECRRNARRLRRYGVTIPQIVRGFKRAHARISPFFHAGVWAEMQNVDSQIALEVMTTLTKQRLPCLPRHDSFITQARHADLLETAMRDSYRTVARRLFGSGSPIGIKREI